MTQPHPRALAERFAWYIPPTYISRATLSAPRGGRAASRQGAARSAAVIELANGRQADLLLIVGDLFDSSRVTEEALEFRRWRRWHGADAGGDDPRKS